MEPKQLLSRIAHNRFARRVRERVRDRVLASEKPGRMLTVYPDDTFITSYPKSGNTWVRFLVASLLHPESPTDFANIDARVPTIYKTSARELDAAPRPRVLKSHEYLDPRYPRVICVVRDPRDVLVSYYHYSIRRGFIDNSASIATFAESFLTGRINEFGTWHENVAGWLAARGDSPRFLLVRYEDLQADCARELGRIAQLLGVDAPAARLAQIARECSFENMRELERTTGEGTLLMQHKRAEIPFVRRGRSGGWREELPPEVTAAVAAAWGPLMTRLGYADDARAVSPSAH